MGEEAMEELCVMKWPCWLRGPGKEVPCDSQLTSLDLCFLSVVWG